MGESKNNCPAAVSVLSHHQQLRPTMSAGEEAASHFAAQRSGVVMQGLLVKKGKRSYMSTARNCVLTSDCFIYSSGDARCVPILNMQVSVARESFTLVDCSDESFTFRVPGKTAADRERVVQQWAANIALARDALVVICKGVLKQGKQRDAVLVNTWLTERALITAEPYKTGANMLLLRTVNDVLPVPLEPALILHTTTGKPLRLTYSTDKHQREWQHLLTEYVRRAKLSDSVHEIESEMQVAALTSDLREAMLDFYQQMAPQKVCVQRVCVYVCVCVRVCVYVACVSVCLRVFLFYVSACVWMRVSSRRA